MALEPEGAGTACGADLLTQGLFDRLTTPGATHGARRRCDFLPDLPDTMLLSLLSAYHRRGVQVAFWS